MFSSKKKVLITGISSGIGLATARKFLAAGASVYGLDIQPPPTDLLGVQFANCNVAEKAAVDAAVSAFFPAGESPEVVFSNAGTYFAGSIEETSAQVFEQVWRVNVGGTWNTLAAVLPRMRAHRHGSIILNGSDQGLVGKRRAAAYGLSKGAIVQLTKSTALDYAQFGIRVNCIAPGAIDTPLCQGAIHQVAVERSTTDGEIRRQVAERHPLGRIGTADDVAHLVYFLASPEAANITGGVYVIDGGYTAQ